MELNKQLVYLNKKNEIEIQITRKKRPGNILLLNFDLMFLVINVRYNT